MTSIANRFKIPFPSNLWGNRFGIHDVINGHDVYGAQGHRGTDFKVGVGTPVPASANGEVSGIFHSHEIGNVVVVRHYVPGDDVYTGHAHLSTTLVQVGQPVSLGTIIARSGDTGSVCYGPHLHLTMSTDPEGVFAGRVFDPIEYMQAFKPTQGLTFQPKYTQARKNEGLIAIAARSHITFPRIRQLNPHITAPAFVVRLGENIRVA